MQDNDDFLESLKILLSVNSKNHKTDTLDSEFERDQSTINNKSLKATSSNQTGFIKIMPMQHCESNNSDEVSIHSSHSSLNEI